MSIAEKLTSIAEKIPKVYEAGQNGAPNDGRTTLSYWYQYLIMQLPVEQVYDENTYEYVEVNNVLESVAFPKGTKNITDFSYMACGPVYWSIDQYYTLGGLRTKAFTGELDCSNGTKFNHMFKGCNKLESIGELKNTSKGQYFHNMFEECAALKSVPWFNTSKGHAMSKMFSGCSALEEIPEIDTSSCGDFSMMFNACNALKKIPNLNTSRGQLFASMFLNCTSLTEIPNLDTSNGTKFGSMFGGCKALTKIPNIDTSKGIDFQRMFNNCVGVTEFPLLDTSNGTNFYEMFRGCTKMNIAPSLNTANAISASAMFYGCTGLTEIKELDMRACNNLTYFATSCSALTTVKLKNIKTSLLLGSGTTYGHLITKDCLIDLIRELRNTGTSTKTLTIGSANLAKLADVYVKTITITDEMRAADDLIDEKIPFEICASTDEGAMLLTSQYVTLKKWAVK